jgi:hypothetical protein
MTVTHQRPLPLTGVVIHLPTVDYAGARAMLGCDEREIAGLVAEGVITWAWNIACRASARPEMRFLAASVKAAQAHRESGTPVPELEEAAVIRLLLGPKAGKPFLRGTDFTRAFNCVPNHTLNLCLDKSLLTTNGNDWRPGPGGSPCIRMDSFRRFVCERRIS